SLIFNILLVLATLVLGGLSFPCLFISRNIAFKVSHLWTMTVLFLFKSIIGVKIEIIGKEYVPTNAALIASKHQSALETIFFNILFNSPVYILKKELLWIPIIGSFFKKLGMIAISRKGTTSLRKLTRRASETLSQGKSLVIFPEGTRSEPGKTGRYRPGIDIIYSDLQIPVTPVALNTGLIWPKNSFRKYPGTVTFHVLPPILPGMDQKTFLPYLKETIESASQDLLDIQKPYLTRKPSDG
ncbi:MAG: 1-acyl-sn-glycerol-3-phosphate acyltransferase, partial [Alphaproteobacteria bacterium]|nr:1-acyl-sn-glycerol-3-phosphate acyltransferase [Alphaproteobacteria bacterium]